MRAQIEAERAERRAKATQRPIPLGERAMYPSTEGHPLS
jgi:hypothetical protein